MKPFVQDADFTLHLGDSLGDGGTPGVLASLADESIDAVVTDPPYGISFMGKHWDRFDIDRRVGNRDVSELWRLSGGKDGNTTRKLTKRTSSAFANGASAAGAYDFSLNGNRRFQAWCEILGVELLRVLKPGGHAVVFGGTRTYHRLAAGLEDAGFEIRDALVWMFGQGFPKSHNLGGEHEGWGTALKPGYEPIVLARKPLAGTVAANMEAHSVGALNIAACGIEIADREAYERNHSGDRGHAGTRDGDEAGATSLRPGGGSAAEARWPANVLLDGEAGELLDEQSGELVSGVATPGTAPTTKNTHGGPGTRSLRSWGDSGGASRFFYCAKVSRAERNAGCEHLDPKPSLKFDPTSSIARDGRRGDGMAKNDHPTVKPIDLMRWLIRLVAPPGGIVLDPCMGSGSTGCAAALEGARFVGVEREPDYMAIADARIRFWREHGEDGLRICAERDAAERKRAALAEAGQLDLLAEAS